MSDAQPLPELPPEPDSAAAPTQPAPAQPLSRSVRKLEVWFDLIDRLAERRGSHEASQAAKAAQPPTRAQMWLDRAVWQVIRFARWLRPHLARNAAAAQKATRSSWRRNALHLKRQTRGVRLQAYGWLLWQLRLLRTDPDRKLAAMGLAGGFLIPMTLIVVLGQMIPPSAPDIAMENAATAPFSDPSVPAPAANIIDAVPGEEATVEPPVEMPAQAPQQTTSITLPPVTAEMGPLTIQNFKFEYFAQRDARGRLNLLSHAAEAMILSAYPIGSRAVEFMRFFGDVMIRSGTEAESANLAAQARCMALPVNKVFPVKTVTCTYGHDVPLPRLARESERSRVFWIVALTYNRNGTLTDLRVHARTTLAATN